MIWAILGPIIFGLTLFIAPNRVALAGAMIVLFLPPIAFFLITAPFSSFSCRQL